MYYQTSFVPEVPLWLALVWSFIGLLVLRYVFWEAFSRLQSATSYIFGDADLVVDTSFFTRRLRQKVDRNSIRAVRQEYDGGRVDGLDIDSWALLVEGEIKIKILSHEEFEKSAWLGPVIADWAAVPYIAAVAT